MIWQLRRLLIPALSIFVLCLWQSPAVSKFIQQNTKDGIFITTKPLGAHVTPRGAVGKRKKKQPGASGISLSQLRGVTGKTTAVGKGKKQPVRRGMVGAAGLTAAGRSIEYALEKKLISPPAAKPIPKKSSRSKNLESAAAAAALLGGAGVAAFPELFSKKGSLVAGMAEAVGEKSEKDKTAEDTDEASEASVMPEALSRLAEDFKKGVESFSQGLARAHSGGNSFGSISAGNGQNGAQRPYDFGEKFNRQPYERPGEGNLRVPPSEGRIGAGDGKLIAPNHKGNPGWQYQVVSGNELHGCQAALSEAKDVKKSARNNENPYPVIIKVARWWVQPAWAAKSSCRGKKQYMATTAAHCLLDSVEKAKDYSYDPELKAVGGTITVKTSFGTFKAKGIVNELYAKNPRIGKQDTASFVWCGDIPKDVKVIPLAKKQPRPGAQVYYGKVMKGEGEPGLYKGKVYRQPGVVAINGVPPGVEGVSVAQEGVSIEQGDSGGPLLVKNSKGQFEQIGVLSTKDVGRNISNYAANRSFDLFKRIKSALDRLI